MMGELKIQNSFVPRARSCCRTSGETQPGAKGATLTSPHLWRDTTGRKRRHPDLAPCDPAGRRRRCAALAAARGHRPSQASQANAGSYREDDHALTMSGLPLHELRVKIGAVVKLLRNLDPG